MATIVHLNRLSLRRTAVAVVAAAIAVLGPQAGAAVPHAQTQTQSPFLPNPEAIAAPREAAVLGRALMQMQRAPDKAAGVAILDKMLRELPEPTPMRGLVQYWRADMLGSTNRHAEAIDAIEESIRLLPNYSGPLFGAAYAYAYANQAGRGADYFLRAIRADPVSGRAVDDYEVGNFIHRLTASRDTQRLNLLSDRLLEIGWVGNALDSRSRLAGGAIERRLREGNVDGAKALVSKLLVPAHSIRLLVSNEFRPVWPEIEMWAGPRLENQWRIYLREARERWSASRNVDAVQDYAEALLAAGHYRTVIREILPLYDGKVDPVRDQDLIFVSSTVAGALARENRWDEVDRLFARAQLIWPLSEKNPNSLNIPANRARFLLYADKPAEALKLIDAALELGRKWEVNHEAITAMYHHRACMLKRLGRSQEAGVAMAVASADQSADDVAQLHLCMGDDGAAVRVLLDALNSEDQRAGVLRYLQRNGARPLPSRYGRDMEAGLDRLRTNPQLLEAVARHGRLLPYSLRDGATPEAR
jgi:tetratricopeptide (TPR) repeat protein